MRFRFVRMAARLTLRAPRLARGHSTLPPLPPLPPPSALTLNAAISHRQQLYTTDAVTPGLIFFLPHGTRVFNKLVTFMKHQQMKYGFEEVITPLIYKTLLWQQSGHWDNYKEDMFRVGGYEQRDEPGACEAAAGSAATDSAAGSAATDSAATGHAAGSAAAGSASSGDVATAEYGLKPMNCPGHCLIFSKLERLYQDLPIRLLDFLSLHRNEASGALTGLTRVRRFHQDDGHIFCEVGQIEQEIGSTIDLIQSTYRVFGIERVEFKLLTRPAKAIGDDATWQRAELALAAVLDSRRVEWLLREGDGAFYGPKIDVLVHDAFGRAHQVGTVQLDFQLPQRFALSYVSRDGRRDNRPIMIHRAVFGLLERFFAILLDHYRGKWPFWLNPRQCVVLPVNALHAARCREVAAALRGDLVGAAPILPLTGYNFYVDVDLRAHTVGARIKDAIDKGYLYIVMVGDRDVDTVAVRTRDSPRVSHYAVDALYAHFQHLERDYR
jgi:threonyl-tRNA synthetase